jgi:hypothetical protein
MLMKKLIPLATASVFFCLSGCSVNNSIYDHLKMMGYSDLSRNQLLSHIDNTYIKGYIDGIYKNKTDIINKNTNSIVINKYCILKEYNSKLSKQDLVITSLIYAENPNYISTATMFAIDHYGYNVVDTVINKVNFINHSCLTSV